MGLVLPVIGTLAFATLPPALLRAYVLGNYVIPSSSMAPTLQVGDRVLSEKLRRRSRPLAPGDIVTFPDPGDSSRTLIKRVVATAGQTVEVADGRLVVDGAPCVEPYAAGPTSPCHLGQVLPHPYRVPEGHVFVMGDNRGHSSDSRRYGAIPSSSVSSRALVIYWPPGRATTL